MVRIANINDLSRIVEIYNQAISVKFQTADTIPITVQDREAWFNSHLDPNYPILVLEENDTLKGWLSISAYRPGRKALQGCVEISYYIDHNYLGQGIGSKLTEEALNVCMKLNFTSVFAIILDRNERSINLMKKFGFSQWAHMPNIADFDGEKCGHVYYGKSLE